MESQNEIMSNEMAAKFFGFRKGGGSAPFHRNFTQSFILSISKNLRKLTEIVEEYTNTVQELAEEYSKDVVIEPFRNKNHKAFESKILNTSLVQSLKERKDLFKAEFSTPTADNFQEFKFYLVGDFDPSKFAEKSINEIKWNNGENNPDLTLNYIRQSCYGSAYFMFYTYYKPSEEELVFLYRPFTRSIAKDLSMNAFNPLSKYDNPTIIRPNFKGWTTHYEPIGDQFDWCNEIYEIDLSSKSSFMNWDVNPL